jgi:hypothetical protein
MLEDSQGLVVTTEPLDAVAEINFFIKQALGYGKHAEATLLKVIAADPGCAVAYAYASACYLSQESVEGYQQARPYLQEAQRYRSRATHREQLYIDAVTAWSKGDIHQAIAQQEAIVDEFPADLIAVQQAQYHYFYQGDKQRLLRVAEKASRSGRDDRYLYGMLAFGLEQCHRLEEAEQVGRQAVAMNRDDPWAQHAVAHVMETQGRVAEGIAWMESFTDTWESCNSMLYTHNWWHLALYYLKQGQSQKVLQLYDRRIWGHAHQASPKDQVGAISLLMRLELEDVQVREHRWKHLAAFVRDRIYDRALPFQDLHYIYALARAGAKREVKEMLLSMEAHAEIAEGQQQSAWKEVTCPAAKCLIAFATGNWQQAAQLNSVLPKLWTIGGSHTQRELFSKVHRSAVRHHQTNPMGQLGRFTLSPSRQVLVRQAS